MKRSVALLWVVGLNACAAPEIAPTDGGVGGNTADPVLPGKGGSGGKAGFANVEFTDPVVVADPAPPPISGGTLLVSPDNGWAAISDPDRDQVVIVDLDLVKVTATIALKAGDEPGRLAEDAAGRLHVALRGGGAIATIDPAEGTLLERRAVCAYPRGLTFDASIESLHVACAEGLLVTLPAATGEATRSLTLDRDLRDVVVENGNLWVSRFRSAEVLRLDTEGAIVHRSLPPRLLDIEVDAGRELSAPTVAWRMVTDPNGGVLVLHQRAQIVEIAVEEGGYGSGSCDGVVGAAVTHFQAGEQPETSTVNFPSGLSVDLAVTGDQLILAAAGAMQSGQLNAFLPAVPTLMRLDLALSSDPGVAGCVFPNSALGNLTVSGQAVAVGYDGTTPVIQLREPSMLIVGGRAVNLPGDSRLDTGHLLFHAVTMTGVACASCHPEGREDGHTWAFAEVGPRRTQSIGGMLAGTAPFHWGGDEATFGALVNDVMTGRMMGPVLTDEHAVALHDWIDNIPPWTTPPGADAAAVERGRALFESEAVACSSCHVGAKLTNNKTYDVGTGAELQVPSLRGLVWRAPFLHHGCADTLADRFGTCGGSEHGDVSALSSAERADLIAYLESL